MFGGTFLLPLYFQLVNGADAAVSGALLAPFLGANCVASVVAGWLARRHGKMKAILVAGLLGCQLGFGLLTLLSASTPRFMLMCEIATKFDPTPKAHYYVAMILEY